MTKTMQLENEAPSTARVGDSYAFGRYRRAIATPNICGSGLLSPFRLKEWHYLSVAGARYFFACAVVSLGYASKMFAYLVDRENPQRTVELSRLHPLGMGVSFAASSIAGRTSWEDRKNRLGIEYVQTPKPGWKLTVDLTLADVKVQGTLHLEDSEALALLFKLSSGNPAYTHKAAGLCVTGSLSANGTPIDLQGAVGGIDWTRSVALRETRWQWSALQGNTPQGQRVGLNLSALVYDDEQGNSQENALWIDGQVIPLGGVAFVLPSDPRRQKWHIHSRSGNEVDLHFTPMGTREEQVNLGIIRSDFIQPYGTYEGTLCPTNGNTTPICVDGMFGVVETHHSIW